MLVSASILSKEKKPIELIKKFNNTNIDYLHIDVMDGKFVKNKTYTFSEIKKFNDISNKPLDVHLMVNNPLKYVKELAVLNTAYITFHYEAIKNIDEVINEVKNYGIKVGISINPKTDIKNLFPYLKDLDLVLIMSVTPGESGQSFISGVNYKIGALKNEIEKNNYKTIISIDGGINVESAQEVKQMGADMVVSASFIQTDEMVQAIKYLKEL